MNALEAFRADLDRLTELSDDELAKLNDDLVAAFDTADTDGADEATLKDIADAIDAVRAEVSNRGSDSPEAADPAEDETVAASVEVETETEVEAEVEAEAGTDEGDLAPDEEEDIESNEDETNTEEEGTDPVTSSAVKVPTKRAPITVTEPVNVITAGADLPGHSAGVPFKDLNTFSTTFAKRIQSMARLTGGDGEKVLVASIESKASGDRTLLAGDPVGNAEKIKAVTNLQTIIASGGCCAPLTTKYDLFTIGATDRPVRDALAGFQADRGGIRFFTSPTLNDIGRATGIWSCTDDAAYDEGDETTWKVCARVDCPPEQTAETEAITMCLTFGVMSSRVFPETVTANTDLSMVQHARLAESHLLSQIKDASTPVTGSAVQYGAVRDFLMQVAKVGAWYRNRHRLMKDAPLRAIVPEWVIDVMRLDMILQPPAAGNRADDFKISGADIENFFDQWGINLTFTPDTPDATVNGGGFYGPLGSDIPKFPSAAEWCLFTEGSLLYLDGGSLDLGLIRDSKLVRANDYMQFSESFEGLAKIGGESLWVTSPIEARGQYSPPVVL